MLSAARTRTGTRISTFSIEKYPFQRVPCACRQLAVASFASGSSKVAQTKQRHPRVSSDSREPWRMREEKLSGSGRKQASKKQAAAFKPKPAKPSHSASRPIFLKPVESRLGRIPAWRRPPDMPPTPEFAKKHRETMKKKFPEGWKPPHKISRQAMEGLRALHTHDPETFTTPALADKLKISPEAVKRILRSKWRPTPTREAKMVEKERRTRQDAIMRGRQEEVMQLIRAGIAVKSGDGLELVPVEDYVEEKLEKIKQRQIANDVLSTLNFNDNR